MSDSAAAPRSYRAAIRTKGDRAYGWGHIIRMTHLAAALRKRHGRHVRIVWFVEGDEAVLRFLRSLPDEIVPIRDGLAEDDERALATTHGPFDLAVIDLFGPPASVERLWSRAGAVSLSFADLPRTVDGPDIVVCPQLLPAGWDGHFVAEARMCVGPAYIALSPDAIRPLRSSVREDARPVVLVMMGGGAIHAEANLLAAKALALLRAPVQARFFLGFDEASELARKIRALLPDAEIVVGNRSPMDAMVKADLGIIAGGFSKYEAAFCGLPTLIVANRAHEVALTEAFESAGLGVFAGSVGAIAPSELAAQTAALLADPKRREMMSLAGELVDGRGADRLLDTIAIRASERSPQLRLRPVSADHMRLLWEWANDPAVRRASFSQAHIAWAEHEAWFASRIRDPSCMMFVALGRDNVPVGQVRLQYDGPAVEISISLAADYRRRGLGVELIRLGSQKALAMSGVETVVAHVRPENAASLQAFERAGYARFGAVPFKGQEAIRLTFGGSASEK